eukprot:364879-Chlamydomonas_euryale.AAC.3
MTQKGGGEVSVHFEGGCGPAWLGRLLHSARDGALPLGSTQPEVEPCRWDPLSQRWSLAVGLHSARGGALLSGLPPECRWVRGIHARSLGAGNSCKVAWCGEFMQGRLVRGIRARSLGAGNSCKVVEKETGRMTRAHACVGFHCSQRSGGASGSTASPMNMKVLVVVLMGGAGVLAGAQAYTDSKMQRVMKASQQTVGKAAVGGPFQLVDTSGKKFTDKDLLGEFALLYFGFTFCPDICPDELEKIAAMVDEVEKGVRARC